MKVNFSSSGKHSPYRMTATSSVGKYQGSGLPAQYGMRKTSPSYPQFMERKSKKGTPPLLMN